MVQKNPLPPHSPKKPTESIWSRVYLLRNKVTPSSGLTGQSIQPPPHSHTTSKTSNTWISIDSVSWENTLGKLLIWKEIPTLQLRKKYEVPPSRQITLIFSNKMEYIKKKDYIIYLCILTILSVSFSQMLGILHSSLYRLYKSEIIAMKAWHPLCLLFCRPVTAPQTTSF